MNRDVDFAHAETQRVIERLRPHVANLALHVERLEAVLADETEGGDDDGESE